MSKYDADLLSVGFKILTAERKGKVAKHLINLINRRHNLLDSIQQELDQDNVQEIQDLNAQIVTYCNQYKIQYDNKVAFERINNIVTHTIKEHAMKTKKNTKKQEEVKATKKPAKKEQDESRAVREEKPVAKKQEAAPKTQPKKAEKTPEKAPASPAPEPQKAEAPKTPTAFKTPCGGQFDSDPSSTCFGMCKDESKEDFELCMNHFKSAMEQKTSRRRVAARNNAQAKTAGTKKAPKRYDRIGDGLGTSAHMINILLLEGATIEEMMDVIPTERTRIMGHLSGLKTGNGHRKPKTIIKDPTDKRYYLEVEEGEPCTYFTIC